MARRKLDLTGHMFGFWRVLNRAPNYGRHKIPRWNCRCRCGVIAEIQQVSLRNGNSKSCGCRREMTLEKRRIADIEMQDKASAQRALD